MKPEMTALDGMKCFLFLCLLAAAVSCSGGKVKDIVTGENTEADLGRIREKDGPVQFRLLVVNESADTLYPLSAYTRCSCISASVDRSPVPPGGMTRIESSYDPAYRAGIFMEEIAVKFLGSGKMLSLIVKGDVIPMVHPVEEDHPYDFGEGLHLSHEVLHFGKMSPGERGMIYIRYANGKKSAMDLSFEAQEGFGDAVSFRSRLSAASGERDTLHFRFTMPQGIPEGDTLKFHIYPSVNGRVLDKSLTVKAISRTEK